MALALCAQTPPVMGTFELVEPLRLVHFALTGTSLRWYGTEAELLHHLTADSSAPPLGQMTLARVHGGARHILLYGTNGRSLVVRRSSGAAMLQIAVSQLLRRAEPTIGANEWVELPQRAAASASAAPSALKEAPAPSTPVRSSARAPRPAQAPPPTCLLIAFALTLLANFSTLGQWKLELTWA